MIAVNSHVKLSTDLLILALAAAVAAALYLLYGQIVARRRADRAVENARARVGGIVESAMDAIVTVDDRQRVVQFNAAAEAVFGWPGNAVIGRDLDMLIPERFRATHRRHVERFGQTAITSRSMATQTVIYGLRADGREFPIEASISQHVESGRKLFTVILRDVTERLRQEEALRQSRDDIRGLGLAAQNLREQEKMRVARELHDELGQALTALKIDVVWMRSHVAPDAAAMHEKLGAMQSLLDGTVAATRRISSDLRPLVLDDLGLAAAADWLVNDFTTRTGIPCELALGPGFEDIPDPHATALFRTLQESLTNIAKHAEARQVEVTLSREDGDVALTVRDDGRGFSPEAPRKPASYGLLGLRERAALLGGAVSIESAPGRGTIVEMRLPEPESGARE